MKVSPILVVGGALFFVGAILFASQLFRNGGWAKSAQFRVLGELFRGLHGSGARTVVLISLVLMPLGSCFLFAGVASSDVERRDRCETRCAAEGYSSGRIGANSDRVSGDRTTWFVACICEGGAGGALELDADSLLQD
ncbi:MAG: hypothetical protein ACI9KE_002266 [Polyangiales bacterium]|jgi:hypothetical protein